tara:strand:- start:61 stop:648 length:588 start_codon:yes stop_codon:yes gene_type:complete
MKRNNNLEFIEKYLNEKKMYNYQVEGLEDDIWIKDNDSIHFELNLFYDENNQPLGNIHNGHNEPKEIMGNSIQEIFKKAIYNNEIKKIEEEFSHKNTKGKKFEDIIGSSPQFYKLISFKSSRVEGNIIHKEFEAPNNKYKLETKFDSDTKKIITHKLKTKENTKISTEISELMAELYKKEIFEEQKEKPKRKIRP